MSHTTHMGLWVNINWQYNATYIQYKDCSKAHYLHDFLRQLLRRKDPSLTSTSGRRQKPANKEANGSSKKCPMMLTRAFCIAYLYASKHSKNLRLSLQTTQTQGRNRGCTTDTGTHPRWNKQGVLGTTILHCRMGKACSMVIFWQKTVFYCRMVIPELL